MRLERGGEKWKNTMSDAWAELQSYNFRWTHLAKIMVQTWSRLGLGFRSVLAIIMPVIYTLQTSLNLFTLHIITRISKGLAINPYHSHSALVICDLVLLNIGTFRFYAEFLGLRWRMQTCCRWPWSEFALLLEPVVLGLLSADQLIVLLLTLDQLCLIKYPRYYIALNGKAKAIGACVFSITVSLAVTIAATMKSMIRGPSGCQALEMLGSFFLLPSC